jgi:hypothetical protein
MLNNDRSNKIIKACGNTLISLLFFALIPLSSAQAQVKGKLDVTTYQTPSGYTAADSSKVARSFVKKYGGNKFSIITIYASTGSFGSPTTDFSRRWKQLIGDIATEKTVPKIEQTTAKNVKIATGAGAVNFQGVNAVAALTTLTVNGRLITVSCVFNDEQGAKDYQAFMEGLDLDDALVNQTATTATTTTNPSNIAQKPNNAVTRPSSSQSFIGRWKLKIYTGGLYARGVAGTVYSYGRDPNVILDYTFNSNGTFKSLVPKLSLGTYKVSNNILKMNFRDGTVEQYTYSFEEANGPNGTIFRYMLLKGANNTESVRFHLE